MLRDDYCRFFKIKQIVVNQFLITKPSKYVLLHVVYTSASKTFVINLKNLNKTTNNICSTSFTCKK